MSWKEFGSKDKDRPVEDRKESTESLEISLETLVMLVEQHVRKVTGNDSVTLSNPQVNFIFTEPPRRQVMGVKATWKNIYGRKSRGSIIA